MEPPFLSEIFGNKATCSSVTFTKTSVSQQFGHWHPSLAYHHRSLFQRWLLVGFWRVLPRRVTLKRAMDDNNQFQLLQRMQ